MFVGVLFFGGSLPLQAESVYQTPRDFIYDVFDGTPPAPEVVEVTDDMFPIIDRILTHSRFRHERVRFWREGERTAWLFDEIGRSFPITMGLVIENGSIRKLKVLVYRESHGWEIRHNFFTAQYTGATLDDDYELSNYIANISGATLSVNASRNTARLALYFDGIAAAVRGRDVAFMKTPD